MATTNITLDDILDMNMEEFEDAISSISKSELNKTEMLLTDYARNTSARNQLENKVALKLNYIKNSKKTKKSLKTVIAKVQDEIKQESTQQPKINKTQKPRNSSLSNVSIKNSSDTPKTTGTNYNYQRGQGDFFGKSSAFKFLKDTSNNNQNDSFNKNQSSFDFDEKVKKTRKSSATSNITKLVISHLDPKALKQITDILMLPGKISRQTADGDKPKRTVKRATKFEKDKLEIRRGEIKARQEHLTELKYKHRVDKRLEFKKLREHKKSSETRAEFLKISMEFKNKVESNKTERLKLNNELKEKLAEKHIENSKITLSKLEFKRNADKDKQEARIALQKQRIQQTNRNQMERHLHAIHPALGMMYGMSSNRQQTPKSNSEGGGIGLGKADHLPVE